MKKKRAVVKSHGGERTRVLRESMLSRFMLLKRHNATHPKLLQTLKWKKTRKLIFISSRIQDIFKDFGNG